MADHSDFLYEDLRRPLQNNNCPNSDSDALASGRQNGLVQCTDEQLRRVGYVRTSPVYPSYSQDEQGNLVDPHPLMEHRIGDPVTYTANIKVRCLEPPPVPSAGVSSIHTRTHYFFILVASTIIISIVNCSH
jgi:hypothetical protein